MSPKTDFEQSLARAAQTLPDHPLPPALRDKVLDRLPAERARMIKPWRRVAVAVLAIVSLAAVCWLSIVVFHPRDPVTAALAAMQEANTWHMSGWKTHRGERRDWEVWGRRKPFFFYEKLGDHITFDDGHKRIEVLPQDVTHGTSSIVIISKSDPKYNNDGSGYTMSFGRGWRKGNWPKTITAHDYIFETFDYGGDFEDAGVYSPSPDLVTHNLVYVNKRTLFPDRLREVQNTNDRTLTGTVIEDVRIELNKSLPNNIAGPTWPSGDVVLDTTAPQDTSKVPKENVTYKDGFSAQLTPLAMDKNGDVLFRVRGWFGNMRLRSASFAQIGAQAPFSEQKFPRGRWPYYDNMGRDYVNTWWPMPPMARPTGDMLFLFSPAAPLNPGQSLPKTMIISLAILAYVGGRGIAEQDIGWTVSLAGIPLVPNFDNIWDRQEPNWRKNWLDRTKATFPAAADDARSWYWSRQSDPGAGPLSRPNHADLLQMVKWEERAVQDSVPISMQANFYRGWLENDYSQIHDYRHERQVLREEIALAKRHPEISSSNDDQAEATLKWLDKKHPQ